MRLALLLATLTVAGCAARADMDQLTSEQQTLSGKVASDHQRLVAIDQHIRRIEDQLGEVKRGGGSAPSGEASDAKLSSIDDRLSRLEAAVTALQAAAGTSSSAGSTAAGGGGSASGEGEKTASLGTSKTTPAAITVAPWQGDLDKELETSKSSSAQGAKLYREGIEALKDAKYPQAIEKLGLLQKKHPKSELTEPAEYFSGNAFYELGKYDQSILQLNDLTKRFPKGRFASAALLRQAQAFLKLSDKIDARLTLQMLISEHADAPEVADARKMLAALERD